MIRVQNRKPLNLISRKTLRAFGGRNLIALTAIALTSVLLTALFTIGGSMLETVQQSAFRQVGGDFHGGFKRLTLAQTEELRSDSRIRESGARLGVGVLRNAPFDKQYTEVSYMEEAYAEHGFCVTTEGRPPVSGKEVACDTRVLELLGIAPKAGAEIPLTITLGAGADMWEISDTFTLTGWWAFDEASAAANVRVTRDYAESIFEDYDVPGNSEFSGSWFLNVFLSSSSHIQEELQSLASDHGYQNRSMGEDGYVDIGVNWGYLKEYNDNTAVNDLLVLGFLLLIVMLAGYLIIYNIFQISVTNDIRFYGLLKVIGTTPRQLRGIIRRQAFILSLAGIPAGLMLGWLLGGWIAPMMQNLGYYRISGVSTDFRIFVFASAFSLLTVFLSCARPGRMAGKVSPIEAVRYTEAGQVAGKNGKRAAGAAKGRKRSREYSATPLGMAAANLNRNRKKTLLAVLSLSLAAVLFQTVYILGSGFDMDKFLQKFVITDFVVGDARYFSQDYRGSSLTEKDVQEIAATGYAAEGGIVWQELHVSASVSASYYRDQWGRFYDPQTLDMRMERLLQPDGGYSHEIQLYGLEAFPMEQLTVLEGSLESLTVPSENAIVAIYRTDDYGTVRESSNYVSVGDTVTVRYEEDWVVRAWEDGRELTAEETQSTNPEEYYVSASRYREVTYTVAALATMPEVMGSRYISGPAFVLGADVLRRDSSAPVCLNYLCNVKEGKLEDMGRFLDGYTKNTAPNLDYESRDKYDQMFAGLRNTVLLMGGILSGLLMILGVLNFLNGELTSIWARKKEFAMLQAVGMTGRQLKCMLAAEGIFRALLAGGISLVLGILSGQVLAGTVSRLLWFFTFRPNFWPVLGLELVYLALGAVIPLAVYHFAARQTVVERLR